MVVALVAQAVDTSAVDTSAVGAVDTSAVGVPMDSHTLVADTAGAVDTLAGDTAVALAVQAVDTLVGDTLVGVPDLDLEETWVVDTAVVAVVHDPTTNQPVVVVAENSLPKDGVGVQSIAPKKSACRTLLDRLLPRVQSRDRSGTFRCKDAPQTFSPNPSSHP